MTTAAKTFSMVFTAFLTLVRVALTKLRILLSPIVRAHLGGVQTRHRESGRLLLWTGGILYTILLPQSVAVAEGADTALGTDAGTGKDYYFLFHIISFFLVF